MHPFLYTFSHPKTLAPDGVQSLLPLQKQSREALRSGSRLRGYVLEGVGFEKRLCRVVPMFLGLQQSFFHSNASFTHSVHFPSLHGVHRPLRRTEEKHAQPLTHLCFCLIPPVQAYRLAESILA